MTVNALDVRCQSCGIPARATTIDVKVEAWNDEMTILCRTCQRLVDAGMLRRDADARGRVCYRQWHFDWTPDDLMPYVEQPS